MRKIIVLLVVVILFAFKPSDNTVNIDEAIKNGLVSCSVTSNKESTHYIKPLLITLTNLKSTPISVKIPSGMQFNPEEDEYQNLIITQEELMALNPGKSLSIPLFAMCTENHDKAPSSDIRYKLGKQADEKVSTLAQYISKNKLHDPLGQSAIWAMTCGTPLEDIAGFDTTAAKELIKYVAHALNKPIPPPPAPDDTRRNYYTTNYSVSMHGAFNYNFSKKTSVTIAMFNENNIVVRELYRNPEENPGKHKLEYTFDATEYTDDFYYLRLIADGEIILNGKIDNRNDFDMPQRN